MPDEDGKLVRSPIFGAMRGESRGQKIRNAAIGFLPEILVLAITRGTIPMRAAYPLVLGTMGAQMGGAYQGGVESGGMPELKNFGLGNTPEERRAWTMYMLGSPDRIIANIFEKAREGTLKVPQPSRR